MDCNLTLITSVDGTESKLVKIAQAVETPSGICFQYTDSNASSILRFFPDFVEIERSGDYGMKLTLKAGETRAGVLSVGGQDGELLVFTHKISFRKQNNRFFAMLKYDLLFGAEKQEMRVRLQADFLGVGGSI